MGIKVLTVEDSTLIRLIINNTIKDMKGIELVGTAENGEIALEKIRELKPDIITLDLVMPVMNGIETLKKLREFSDIPVIILSARSDMQKTIEALELGAQDFLTKPESITRTRKEFRAQLEARFKALVHDQQPGIKPVVKKEAVIKSQEKSEIKNEVKIKPQQKEKPKVKIEYDKPVEAVVIGASTGGPKMLTALIKTLPKDLSIPIFIVQHMPAGFTASFAKRLDLLSDVRVVEAKDNMRVENGTVYLAPGGLHMVVNKKRIRLLDTAKVHSVKPAIDPMFSSAVEVYGGNMLAVIMTGMGRDGAEGCVEVKHAGGYVIVQDEATSVVYGMPKCAVDTGAVDAILSIDDIIIEINERIEG